MTSDTPVRRVVVVGQGYVGLPLTMRALEVGFETAKTRVRYALGKLRTCMGAYLAPEAFR